MISIDGKQIVNMIYHATVESVLAIGYAQLGRKHLNSTIPKVDFSPSDIGMLTLNVGMAMATRDMLIKQGILPGDIMK